MLSSSNWRYPSFWLLSYFPWLCAWDVCFITFCHLLRIRSGKTGNLFSLSLCSLWWVQIFGYVLACRLYSYVCTVHHLTIIIVQTYLKALNSLNACQIHFSSVWVRLSIVSPLSIKQYVGMYVFSLPISLVIMERIYIYILSYYHHQIESMNYYLLFMVRSWNNGVRCMSFYILIWMLQTHTLSLLQTDMFYTCCLVISKLSLVCNSNMLDIMTKVIQALIFKDLRTCSVIPCLLSEHAVSRYGTVALYVGIGKMKVLKIMRWNIHK